MDDSWSWDGSLISLHSSMAASTRPSSPNLNSNSTDRDSQSIQLPPPAALRTDTTPYRSSYRLHTPPAINTRPPSPVSREGEQAGDAPLQTLSSTSPTTFESSTVSPHPLASILLSELSPPASPVPSTASYPRSGSRSRINSTTGSVGRAGRGRTRTRRRTSISSTTSNDGSAPGEGRDDEEEESGASSAEDNSNHAQGGLVMPSLTLERRQSVSTSSRGRSSQAEGDKEQRSGRKVKLLILGKSGEDRRTISALLSNDEDLQRQPSSASVDLSYSILSSVRSHHARSSSERSQSTSDFVSSGSCGSAVTLSYSTTDDLSHEDLLYRLRRPLEQLEAKLESTFPSTESLASLVDSSGAGEFDASLFLFSSPPLPCEIAVARTISHLLPILPVLILPPSPTSKPQKTTALSNAVIQQLDSAGVRWMPVEDFDRRESKSPTRRGGNPRQNEIGGGPLTMLPHDLFIQNPPSQTHFASSQRDHSSTPTTSFPSPTSEPTSLTSSQELPPLSPTFTSASSYYRTSSSRASSTRSLSPSSTTGRNTANLHHLTLLDLHRLRRILHTDDVASKIRRARALTFLEWRDVEVAARGIEMVKVESLPREWEEKTIACSEAARVGRRGLDFSKRVAERRKALGCKVKNGADKERELLRDLQDQDDGDVLDMEEEEREEEPGSRPALQDPTTPKPCFRNLPSSSSIFAPLSTPTPTSSNVSSASSSSKSSPSNKSGSSARSPSPSYFPPFPAAPLSASIVSIPSSAERSDSSSSSSSTSNVSISLMKPCNPFHFPSFLHLVGLNLRLALFHPRTSHETSTSLFERKRGDVSSRDPISGKASRDPWWKTFAVLSVVFAAGVVAGVQVVERLDRSIA
ncbi:hypothetical protein JCM3765_003544 [Sporobolomyces pararoseus]